MSESIEHNDDELMKAAPILSAISRDEFSVPEEYFAKLESDLQKKFQEGSSELQVPHDFFDSMHSDILNKITTENVETKVIPLKNSNVAFWISTGLSIAAVGLLIFWFLGSQEEECETFACLLEQTELTNDDLMVLDEDDIFELIGEDQELIESIELDSDELLDYLENDLEDISIDELYE